MSGEIATRIEEVREQLPELIGKLAQVAADNPKPLILAASIDYVIGSAVANLVKPRGVPGVIACTVVSYVAGTLVVAELMKRDVITFKIREGKQDDASGDKRADHGGRGADRRGGGVAAG